jgi:hypothetical protein
MEEPLSLNNSELAADQVVARAELAQQNCVMAGQNLKIAQHRDELRYARIRGGGYTPKIRKFEPGDFVYVQRQGGTTLDPAARREILRVKSVEKLGTLVLEGKCGRVTTVNASNAAPCHLPDIDGTFDFELARPDSNKACQICRMPDREAEMLLCDFCDAGWHMSCLSPPLEEVPKGDWACPQCLKQHPDLAKVNQAREHPRDAARSLAAQYDGRMVSHQAIHPSTGLRSREVYPVKYLGKEAEPMCFEYYPISGPPMQLSLRQLERRMTKA